MLSDRIQTLSPSLTIAIASLARDLKAQGKDILSFSAGEPDFGTPQRSKMRLSKLSMMALLSTLLYQAYQSFFKLSPPNSKETMA